MNSDRHVLNNSSIYVKGKFWPMSPCIAFFLNNEWRFLEVIVPVIREAQDSHYHFRSSFVCWPWCPRKSQRDLGRYIAAWSSHQEGWQTLWESVCAWGGKCVDRLFCFFLWLQFQPSFSAGSSHYLMSFPIEAAGKLEEG